MHVVLCATVKEEDPYLEEWISYHLNLGISHIYLYDNHAEPNPNMPFNRPQITVLHCPTQHVQLLIYYHFHTKVIKGCGCGMMPAWIGFIDIDEFLVIKDKPKDIPLAMHLETWAAKAPNTGALVFHWALFGSNGHTNVQEGNYNVLSRFTKRARELNPLVKWFVRPEALKYMVSPHHGELHAPYVARDVLGRPVPEAYDHDPARELCLPIACLHHYFTKSREEFKRKCERGRADLTEKRTMDDFDRHDLNEVEDISALAFATGVIQNKN